MPPSFLVSPPLPLPIAPEIVVFPVSGHGQSVRAVGDVARDNQAVGAGAVVGPNLRCAEYDAAVDGQAPGAVVDGNAAALDRQRVAAAAAADAGGRRGRGQHRQTCDLEVLGVQRREVRGQVVGAASVIEAYVGGARDEVDCPGISPEDISGGPVRGTCAPIRIREAVPVDVAAFAGAASPAAETISITNAPTRVLCRNMAILPFRVVGQQFAVVDSIRTAAEGRRREGEVSEDGRSTGDAWWRELR